MTVLPERRRRTLITTRHDPAGPLLRIDGRLDGEGVAELERVLASLPRPSRVEVTDLRSAAGVGVEALRALRARGIPLSGVSPYAGLLLQPGRPGLDPASSVGRPARRQRPGGGPRRRPPNP